MKIELANERHIILELKAKMADIGEVRSSNMELIDQLQKAKSAVEKLSNLRDKLKSQITVSYRFLVIYLFYFRCLNRNYAMN